MFDNCMLFNTDESDLGQMARKFKVSERCNRRRLMIPWVAGTKKICIVLNAATHC